MIELDLVPGDASDLGESPAWDPDTEELLYVDILAGRVHRWSPGTGAAHSADMGQPVGAVAWGGAHGTIAAVADGFAVLDSSGQARALNSFLHHQTDTRMNDGKTDPAGRFVAGTTSIAGYAGEGALYRLEDNGSATLLLDGLSISNGMAWSADGAQLFHIDTPSNSVRAYDYDTSRGRLTAGRCVVYTDGYTGSPDGMTIDADGNLWVAFWEGGAVRCFDDRGHLLEQIPLPTGLVTSCTFGGRDLATLYITTARLGLSQGQLEQEPLAGRIFSAGPGVVGVRPTPWRGCDINIGGGLHDESADLAGWHRFDLGERSGPGHGRRRSGHRCAAGQHLRVRPARLPR